MSWHQTPKDDAWKRVTPASVAALGQRLWLRCGACGHDTMVPAISWCRERGLPPDTPLLAIAKKLRCQRCGEKKSHCWPEPHGMPKQKS